MTAMKVAKTFIHSFIQSTSLKYVNWRSFKIHRSSSMALSLSSVGEFFWS